MNCRRKNCQMSHLLQLLSCIFIQTTHHYYYINLFLKFSGILFASPRLGPVRKFFESEPIGDSVEKRQERSGLGTRSRSRTRTRSGKEIFVAQEMRLDAERPLAENSPPRRLEKFYFFFERVWIDGMALLLYNSLFGPPLALNSH
jgi:hypothetical protein